MPDPVRLEKHQDFHAGKMFPAVNLLGRTKPAPTFNAFKATAPKKVAADFGTTEPERIRDLLTRIGYEAYRNDPNFFQNWQAKEPGAWAIEISRDPQLVGTVLSAYGAEKGVPALQDLGAAFIDPSGALTQANDANDQQYASASGLNLGGDIAAVMLRKYPALAKWPSLIPNIGGPAIQLLPHMRRFRVDRASMNGLLDHVDSALEYTDARDAEAQARRSGADPAVINQYAQNKVQAQQKAVQTGGAVLKPEYTSGTAMGGVGSAAGAAGDLTSTVLSPASALMQFIPQGLADTKRLFGGEVGPTQGEQDYAAITGTDPGTDPTGSRLYSYGKAGTNAGMLAHGGRYGALALRLLSSGRGAGLAARAGLPGLAAYAGLQGINNAAVGMSEKGQENIQTRMNELAAARASGKETSLGQFFRDAVMKAPGAALGLSPANETQAALAQAIGGENAETEQVAQNVRDESRRAETYKKVYDSLAGSMADADPNVLTALAQEATTRLMTAQDAQRSPYHRAQNEMAELHARALDPIAANSPMLRRLIELAPNTTGSLIAGDDDATSEAWTNYLTQKDPGQLPQVVVNTAEGPKPFSSGSTTASWDPTQKKWINDAYTKAQKVSPATATVMEATGAASHAEAPDTSPSRMIQRFQQEQQPRIDADAQARIAAQTVPGPVDTGQAQWDQTHQMLNQVYSKYEASKPTFDAAHNKFLTDRGIDPSTSMAELYKRPVPSPSQEIATAAVRPVVPPEHSGLPQTKPGGFTFADPAFHPSQPNWQAKIQAQMPKPVQAAAPAPIVPNKKLGASFSDTATATGLAWWTT